MRKKEKLLCSAVALLLLFTAFFAGVRLVTSLPAAPAAAEPPAAAVGQPQAPRKIYIDPGHGGFDFGAVGYTATGEHLREKDLVLDISLSCGRLLRDRGNEVLFSRTGDERMTYTTAAAEVRARRAAAEGAGADLLISIHANAYAGQGRAYGARVYYHPESPQSQALALALADAITARTAAHIGRACRAEADGSYYVLGNPARTAVLVEVGFLSDRVECTLLAEAWYRQALAEAIGSV